MLLIKNIIVWEKEVTVTQNSTLKTSWNNKNKIYSWEIWHHLRLKSICVCLELEIMLLLIIAYNQCEMDGTSFNFILFLKQWRKNEENSFIILNQNLR